MEVTLGAGTLIPIGSVITFLGAVWYLSTKVSEIQALKQSDADIRKALEATALRTDFEKHLLEDSAHHSTMIKEMSDVKLVQARDGERWVNVQAILQVIQADLKKVLNK